MSKKRFLEKIEVKKPCSEDWNHMRGNEQVRFCSHCSHSVNNLSAMTRKEAMKIVSESEGRICVRYIVNPVTNKPVFSGELHQIARRAPRLAAGLMAAALSLSSTAYAQKDVLREPLNCRIPASQETQSNEDTTGNATTGISGTLLDPNGAVVPGFQVTLTNDKTGESRFAISNDEGFYEFQNLAAGIYTLKSEGKWGFKEKEIREIMIAETDALKLDINVDVGDIGLTGLIVVTPAYENALFTAVFKDDLEAVKNLIARGENVNAKDENYDNITPLFLAVENGNAEIAETLLNFGAKINARDENKRTPLMRLDEDATPELVRLLIKHGAKVNAVDKDKNTPLILAASSAGAEVLQILIQHDARLNAQNDEGQTALMNAAYEDKLESVRALILAGADVNLKNKEDETARDLTSEEEIEKLLESYGAKVGEEESSSDQ